MCTHHSWNADVKSSASFCSLFFYTSWDEWYLSRMLHLGMNAEIPSKRGLLDQETPWTFDSNDQIVHSRVILAVTMLGWRALATICMDTSYLNCIDYLCVVQIDGVISKLYTPSVVWQLHRSVSRQRALMGLTDVSPLLGARCCVKYGLEIRRRPFRSSILVPEDNRISYLWRVQASHCRQCVPGFARSDGRCVSQCGSMNFISKLD